MRRFGQLLMALGAAVGAAAALAVFAHLGIGGVPWLVNVALAKLGFIGAVGLMTGGAISVRLAARRELRKLGSPPAS
ncbi:MAG: hypothetical protein ABIP93_03910 [Gemmatimonadaceae bacterium]